MCQNIEGEKDMRNEEYLCIIKIKEKLCISLACFFSSHPFKSTPARKKQSAIPDLPYTPAPSESS